MKPAQQSILCGLLGASLSSQQTFIPGGMGWGSAPPLFGPSSAPTVSGPPRSPGFASPNPSAPGPSASSSPSSTPSTPSSNSSLSVDVSSSYGSKDFVNRNFLAFGFEQSAFVHYALTEDGSTNQFSVNLIDAIMSRTGGTPIIRLGGTSADYGFYVEDQKEHALPSALLMNDIGNTTIGPSYWELPSRFPDAQYVIQVPLATTDHNETCRWTEAAISTMKPEQIYSIEVGNEPNWYAADYEGTHEVLGPANWQAEFTNETYVGNWTERVEKVLEMVDLPYDKIFQAFDVASHNHDASPVICYLFKVEECFDLGIDDGNHIKTVAHHYYQNMGGDAADLADGDNLMNMAYTHERLDYFHCSVDYLKENRPDIEFVISELGNSLASHYNPKYQDRMGSALWQTDLYLYLMAMGVDRLHFQQMFVHTYQQNMWQPVEYQGVAPFVGANFYSQPFVADFVGKSGETTMKQLDISPAQDNVAVYAAFESGEAKRVAVVNMNYWNQTSSSTARTTASIDLSVPSHVKTVRVDHLNSPLGAGADATTMTYAGSQWTYDSLGMEVTGVRDDSKTLHVKNGRVTVSVDASSAALISFS